MRLFLKNFISLFIVAIILICFLILTIFCEPLNNLMNVVDWLGLLTTIFLSYIAITQVKRYRKYDNEAKVAFSKPFKITTNEGKPFKVTTNEGKPDYRFTITHNDKYVYQQELLVLSDCIINFSLKKIILFRKKNEDVHSVENKPTESGKGNFFIKHSTFKFTFELPNELECYYKIRIIYTMYNHEMREYQMIRDYSSDFNMVKSKIKLMRLL